MSVLSRRSKIDASSVPGVAQRARVTLTSAQILALHGTPVAILPAPGANKYQLVQEVVAKLNFGTTQYTGANAMEIRYTDGSGVKVTGDIASAFLDAGANRVDRAVSAAVAVAVANAAVVAVVPTANPAAGDSTITLDILYRTVSI
jgi:hypothetical protein